MERGSASGTHASLPLPAPALPPSTRSATASVPSRQFTRTLTELGYAGSQSGSAGSAEADGSQASGTATGEAEATGPGAQSALRALARSLRVEESLQAPGFALVRVEGPPASCSAPRCR